MLTLGIMQLRWLICRNYDSFPGCEQPGYDLPPFIKTRFLDACFLSEESWHLINHPSFAYVPRPVAGRLGRN
jgi:hypothetical protein